jgi:hypothetical protein
MPGHTQLFMPTIQCILKYETAKWSGESIKIVGGGK